MKQLKITATSEGMKIGKDIMTASGQCLISEGTVLTAASIKSLIRHGIENIHVMDEEDKKKYTDEELRTAESFCIEEVSSRFRAPPEDRMMKTVFSAALKSAAMEYLRRNRG